MKETLVISASTVRCSNHLTSVVTNALCSSLQGPNNTVDNPPQYCLPTIGCQVTRLQQVSKTCQVPQGIYEPIVCDPGHYCPSGGKSKIRCPSRHFCPMGSYEPIQCSYGAICPSGSQREINTMGLATMIAIDFLLLIFISGPTLWNSYRFRRRKARTTHLAGEEPSCRGSSELAQEAPEVADIPLCDVSIGGRIDTTYQDEEVIAVEFRLFIESLARCVGTRELGLSFAFEDLGLKLANGKKEILAGVTGFIKSGSMWGVMGASGAGKCIFPSGLQ